MAEQQWFQVHEQGASGVATVTREGIVQQLVSRLLKGLLLCLQGRTSMVLRTKQERHTPPHIRGQGLTTEAKIEEEKQRMLPKTDTEQPNSRVRNSELSAIWAPHS